MPKTTTKYVQDEARLGGKGHPLESVQGIKIWPYNEMVEAQTRICSSKWDP